MGRVVLSPWFLCMSFVSRAFGLPIREVDAPSPSQSWPSPVAEPSPRGAPAIERVAMINPHGFTLSSVVVTLVLLSFAFTSLVLVYTCFRACAEKCQSRDGFVWKGNVVRGQRQSSNLPLWATCECCECYECDEMPRHPVPCSPCPPSPPPAPKEARKFPHHRFTIQRQKAMAAEFERNRWPGWLQFDIDFAMDGTIPPPQGRSMQSDHWSPMSFTCFVNIVSWLRTDVWISRSSQLKKGDAVTVELAELSIRDATEPATGSYWAEVVSIPSASAEQPDPERQVYGVRPHGASAEEPLKMIERRFLRHRKLHTKAFIHISDDKTHDSHAAQTFINSTLDYLDQHFVQTGLERFVALHVRPSMLSCMLS